MASPTFVSYAIYLTDKAKVANLQQQYPNGLNVPPSTAATTYSAPIGGQTPGGAITYPGIFAYFPNGWGDTQFTNNYGNLSFTANSPDGRSFTFQWVGFFLFGNSFAQATPVGSSIPTVPLGSRVWVDGGEISSFGEGGSGNFNSYVCRDASRTVDGMGYAYRSLSNIQRTHSVLGSIRNHYERFYIRLRTLPTAEDEIWYVGASAEANIACRLNVSTTGQLVGYNQGNGQSYPGTALFTTNPLTVGVWYKIDIYQRFSINGTSDLGLLQLAINGVIVASAGGAGTTGIQSNQFWRNSQLGQSGAVASHGLEADFDDWIGANEFVDANGISWGIDLTSGSHVQLVRATGFGALHNSVAWGTTGVEWRTFLDNPRVGSYTSNNISSITPLAKLDITTDYGDLQLGCPAFNVGFFPVIAASVNMTLGWVINGVETDNTIAVVQNTWNSVLQTVPSGTLRTALTRNAPLRFIFIKENFNTNTSPQFLGGSQEIMGVFGPEDLV